MDWRRQTGGHDDGDAEAQKQDHQADPDAEQRCADGSYGGAQAADLSRGATGKSASASLRPAFFARSIRTGRRHSGMKPRSLHPMIVVSGIRLSRASFAGPPNCVMMSDAVCMS